MTTKKTEAEKPANEQANIAPATEVNASGAPQQVVPDVDLGHPAVDNDPRAGTTIDQNRIDSEAEKPANEQANIAPATEVNASGAPQQVVPDVDLGHPAVDNDPRAGTTIDQNRIDFNDPTLSGQEAVEKNLADQAGE